MSTKLKIILLSIGVGIIFILTILKVVDLKNLLNLQERLAGLKQADAVNQAKVSENNQKIEQTESDLNAAKAEVANESLTDLSKQLNDRYENKDK